MIFRACKRRVTHTSPSLVRNPRGKPAKRGFWLLRLTFPLGADSPAIVISLCNSRLDGFRFPAAERTKTFQKLGGAFRRSYVATMRPRNKTINRLTNNEPRKTKR